MPSLVSSRRAFTLTELLVVVGIMGLLTAVSLPAIRGVTRAANLTNSGNVVAAMLDRARGQAMARNAPAAVVVVTSGGGTNSYDYRAIALFQFDAPSSAWTQAAAWYILPSAAVFDSTASGAGVADFFQATPSLPSALPAPRLNGATVAAFACQYFLPSGQLYGQSEPVLLRLVDAQPSGATTNFYDIVINQDTGRMKVSRP